MVIKIPEAPRTRNSNPVGRRRFGLLFVAGLLAIGGCERPAASEGTLVVAIEAMPHALDPRFGTDAVSSRISGLVYRSLATVDRSLRYQADLARDWTFEDDRSLVFRLRRDVRFHDGTPLTSADVRATFESILDPALASPKREQLAFVDAIETPDPWTVRLRMRKPFAPALTVSTIGIVPETASGRETLPPGSGPFRIAEVVTNRHVLLEAIPGHEGLHAIRFRVVPDDTVRTLEAHEGRVHLVQNAIEPENLGWLEKGSDLCVDRRPGTTFHYLGFNLEDPRLGDVRVRRAIAHAIDRQALVRHLLDGTARVATGLLAPGHWAYEPDVASWPHDPARARRLLDDAGFPDPDGPGPLPRFELTYKTTTLDSRRRIAEAIQAALAEVGIRVRIRSFEWGTFYADIRRGNFQLYALAWVGVVDPDIYFDILSSSMMPPRGNNRGRYRSKEMDRLTRLGREALDESARRAIYADVQELASRDLPFVPLWWTDNVVVHDPRLCGFEPYPDGSLVSLRTAFWRSDAGNASPPPCGCAS